MSNDEGRNDDDHLDPESEDDDPLAGLFEEDGEDFFSNLIPEVDELDQWLDNGIDDGPYYSVDPKERERETFILFSDGPDGARTPVNIDGRLPTARQWWFLARSTHGENRAQALQYYKKVIDMEPRCKAAYIHASIIMANAGDYAGSYEVVKKALKFKPTDIDFLWRAARDCNIVKDFGAIDGHREAYALWRQESGYDDADFLGYIANAMQKRGDPIDVFRPLLNQAAAIAADGTQKTHEDWGKKRSSWSSPTSQPGSSRPAVDLEAIKARKMAAEKKKAATVEKIVVDKEAAARAERELLEDEEDDKGKGKKKGKNKKK
jgi:tetratricopeptide (TPR) repeat protein